MEFPFLCSLQTLGYDICLATAGRSKRGFNQSLEVVHIGYKTLDALVNNILKYSNAWRLENLNYETVFTCVIET